EATGLLRSAAGHRSGEEIDDQEVLADVLAGLPGLAFVVRGFKLRRRVAHLQVHLLLIRGQRPARKACTEAQTGQRCVTPSSHEWFSLSLGMPAGGARVRLQACD